VKVTIEEYISPAGLDCSAPPLPLRHGFTKLKQYKVHQFITDGQELRAVLTNDRGEIWAISNRHLRVVSEDA
jgi:hypothetical protein